MIWSASSSIVRSRSVTTKVSFTGVTVTVNVELDVWTEPKSTAVKAMSKVPFQ